MRPKSFAIATNLAYPLVGALALLEGGPLALMFFLACLGLGLGSGYFHYVEDEPRRVRRCGQRADEIGIYLVFSTLVWLAIGVTSWLPVLIGWIGLAVLAPKLNSYVAAPALALIAILAVAFRGEPPWALVDTALFAAAYAMHRMGDASSWGHSAWHLLSAFGILGLYASLTALA